MKVEIKCRGAAVAEVDKLQPFQGNLKDLSKENYQKLRKEILELGFSAPIFVWRTDSGDYILDGHQRVRTLQQMRSEGIEVPHVPINLVDAKSEAEAKRKVLALTSQYGEMTTQGLYEFMSDADITFPEIGDSFRFPEIDLASFEVEFFGEPEPPDTESEPPLEPSDDECYVKSGDVWQCGDHTVICGDNTRIDPVRAKMLFTSPPYADQREYTGESDLSVDSLADAVANHALSADLACVNLGISRKGGAINRYWDTYINAAEARGLKLLSWNIWDRGAPYSVSQQTAMFPIEHEWIFVFGREPFELNLTIENKYAGQRGAGSNRQADGSLKRKNSPKVVRDRRALGTIFRCAPHRGRDVDHPAMVPVEFVAGYLAAAVNPGEVVTDIYLGSGTTMIACEQFGAKCTGMEVSPNYAQVSIERWQNLTGKKAERISEQS